MRWFERILAVVLLGVLIQISLRSGSAKADTKDGIYWHSTTSADGVHVRRLEDTTYGTICYVAKGNSDSYPSVAISCIKAKP